MGAIRFVGYLLFGWCGVKYALEHDAETDIAVFSRINLEVVRFT